MNKTPSRYIKESEGEVLEIESNHEKRIQTKLRTNRKNFIEENWVGIIEQVGYFGGKCI